MTPWLLRVLRAFRNTMDADQAARVPNTLIGWPTRAMKQGPYAPFVWFRPDRITVYDGRVEHDVTIIVGVVVREDAGKNTESELEQAIAAFFTIQQKLALAAEDPDSTFNAAFEGHAMQDADEGGAEPAETRGDFDGHSVIAERWRVVGTSAAVGADNA